MDPPAHVAEDRIKIGGPPEELFLAQASVTNIYIYIQGGPHKCPHYKRW